MIAGDGIGPEITAATLLVLDALGLKFEWDEQYGGMSCCGTFTHGHVDARCLDELFRILRPGAPFAFTVKLEVFEALGFKDKLGALTECGGITELAFTHDRHYDNAVQPDGVFCAYCKN